MGVPQAQFWEMWVPESNFLFNFASFWVSEQNFRVSETPGQPLRTALQLGDNFGQKWPKIVKNRENRMLFKMNSRENGKRNPKSDLIF